MRKLLRKTYPTRNSSARLTIHSGFIRLATAFSAPPASLVFGPHLGLTFRGSSIKLVPNCRQPACNISDDFTLTDVESDARCGASSILRRKVSVNHGLRIKNPASYY